MSFNHIEIIARELGIAEKQVENTVVLLDSGATIPFIARYRKEATGCLDEVQIMQIRDRYEQLKEIDKRRTSIIESLKEQEKLTSELEQHLNAATSLPNLKTFIFLIALNVKHALQWLLLKDLNHLQSLSCCKEMTEIHAKATEFIDEEKGVITKMKP